MLKHLPLLFILLVFVSCDSNTNQPKRYWNSSSYFQSETSRLTNAPAGLQKRLLFENKNETTKQLSPDWKKELEPFLSIDLQKISYQGRFDVDTLIVGDSVYHIEYKATDKQTDLQQCTIISDKRDGTILSVSGLFTHINSLYQSTKTYTYNPKEGYSIKGDQQVKLVHPVDYEIEGVFILP